MYVATVRTGVFFHALYVCICGGSTFASLSFCACGPVIQNNKIDASADDGRMVWQGTQSWQEDNS